MLLQILVKIQSKIEEYVLFGVVLSTYFLESKTKYFLRLQVFGYDLQRFKSVSSLVSLSWNMFCNIDKKLRSKRLQKSLTMLLGESEMGAGFSAERNYQLEIWKCSIMLGMIQKLGIKFIKKIKAFASKTIESSKTSCVTR